MTDDELMERMREDAVFNPWLNKVDEFRANLQNGTRKFVLDQEKVDEYESRIGALKNEDEIENFRLRLELLPQPFIGSPEANVWLLLKNPGYSEIDYYDHLGSMTVLSNQPAQQCDKESLKQRQDLMLAQYTFKQDSGKQFYLLNEVFHTSTISGKGGYGWYSRYLFPRDGLFCNFCSSNSAADRLRFCSQNLFVLDYHPYHSESYCEEFSDILKDEYWDRLIEHALSNKKLLVFWGSKVLGRVKKKFEELYDKAVSEGRVYVLKGASAYFSSNCLFQVVGKHGDFMRSYLQVKA